VIGRGDHGPIPARFDDSTHTEPVCCAAALEPEKNHAEPHLDAARLGKIRMRFKIREASDVIGHHTARVWSLLQ